MYFPSLCLENFYFDDLGCLWIAALDFPSPSPSPNCYSVFLSGFLLSEFVSYQGIATKSQNIIMGSRLVDIAKISMIYLLYLAEKQ